VWVQLDKEEVNTGQRETGEKQRCPFVPVRESTKCCRKNAGRKSEQEAGKAFRKQNRQGPEDGEEGKRHGGSWGGLHCTKTRGSRERTIRGGEFGRRTSNQNDNKGGLTNGQLNLSKRI